MRHFNLIFLIVATVSTVACTKGTTPTALSVKSPAIVGPVTPSPTPTATPAPVIPAWPTVEAVQTSTFGGYSCSATMSQGAECFDGISIFTQPAPYVGEVDQVIVGDGIACAILDSNGIPNACTTSLTDPACINTPTSAAVVCWTPSAVNPVLMNTATQAGFDSADFYAGPVSMSVDGAGNICITNSVYNQDFSYNQDTTQCGKKIQTGGLLQ